MLITYANRLGSGALAMRQPDDLEKHFASVTHDLAELDTRLHSSQAAVQRTEGRRTRFIRFAGDISMGCMGALGVVGAVPLLLHRELPLQLVALPLLAVVGGLFGGAIYLNVSLLMQRKSLHALQTQRAQKAGELTLLRMGTTKPADRITLEAETAHIGRLKVPRNTPPDYLCSQRPMAESPPPNIPAKSPTSCTGMSTAI